MVRSYGESRRCLGRAATLVLLCGPMQLVAQSDAPIRVDRSRFTILAYPRDQVLAHALANAATAADTRLRPPAPDNITFRHRSCPGSRIAFATGRLKRSPIGEQRWRSRHRGRSRKMQEVGRLRRQETRSSVRHRHELAHLALHEYLGDLPHALVRTKATQATPRGEWTRDDMVTADLALAIHGIPTRLSLMPRLAAGQPVPSLPTRWRSVR